MEKHKIKEALHFIDRVKSEGGHTLSQSFMDLMVAFETQQIDVLTLIRRVTDLFEGREELLDGFEVFIPEEEMSTQASQMLMDSSTSLSPPPTAMNDACPDTPCPSRESPPPTAASTQPTPVSPGSSPGSYHDHSFMAIDEIHGHEIQLPLLVLATPIEVDQNQSSAPTASYQQEDMFHTDETVYDGLPVAEGQLVGTVFPADGDFPGPVPSNTGPQPAPQPSMHTRHTRRRASTNFPRLRRSWKKPALRFHRNGNAEE